MSVKQKRVVEYLVDKFRSDYPTAPRALLHKTIRLELEHRKIPFTDAIEKQLERALNRTFPKELKKEQQPASDSEEVVIEKVIQVHFPNGIPLYSRVKYRPTTDEVEETIRDAGIQVRRDPKDPEFRELMFKLFKRCHEESARALQWRTITARAKF